MAVIPIPQNLPTEYIGGGSWFRQSTNSFRIVHRFWSNFFTHLKLLFENRKKTMKNQLGKISIEQRSGNLPLTFNNHPTDFKLIDFERWSVSEIKSNVTRGRFAQIIVASALHTDHKIIRYESNTFDMNSPEGNKIEVKSW